MHKLLPSFGILIFIALYFYTASIYPGGSPNNPNSLGYDWLNNLWCHLMNPQAINGMDNPASPIAIFAMILLGISMIVFFLQFARVFAKSNFEKNLIRITGVVAMVSAGFIFTSYHDVMTTILSICGVVGITSIIRALYMNKLPFLGTVGIICMIVIGLNNYFYYNEAFHEYLPVVQLLDFVLVLGWTVGINLRMKIAA